MNVLVVTCGMQTMAILTSREALIALNVDNIMLSAKEKNSLDENGYVKFR